MVDSNWNSILDEIVKGNVVPIIGNDLSLVKGKGDKPTSLYKVMARQITRGTEIASDKYSIHELTLKAHAAKIPDIYKKIRSIYNKIKNEKKIYTRPLEFLAKITDFNFYITTAIDDLLEETIRTERKCATGELDIINYSLKSKSRKPVNPKVSVFKIMGSLTDFDNSAIDEAKMLEHLISISSRESETHPQTRDFIEKTAGKTFLFIGCDFPDWLMRLFIRVSTNRNLNRTTHTDYVINKSPKEDDELNAFLTHCEKKYVILEGSGSDNALVFVEQLYRRWVERKKEKKKRIRDEKLVFLSYHGKDKKHAINLKKKLEAEGIQVWFDKTDLKDGIHVDKIREVIAKRCKIFLPLISEGVLKAPKLYARRIEWAMAEYIYMANKYSGREGFYLFPYITDNSDREDVRIPKFLRDFKIFKLKDKEDDIINSIKIKFGII